ncbi:hypothetical protein L4X63_04765 [Geomonas sp. Red32]|uniref:hypothetical protein n=1 Tax=Geomonas sp. Red32 TaxID=2912856 RepID=UPI00202D05E0|nr:hypothetical protein [Geomonas sp. Red32]MCM0080899.1 hypothetical protein [Geomonas sp. Red32]
MSTSNPPLPASGRVVLWLLLAVGGCAVWALLVNGAEPERAWRSLLINFLFFTSLSGGLVVWPAVVESCNGRWHLGIDRLPAAGIGYAVPSLAVLVILWIGSSAWAPWYQRQFAQGRWLDNSFLFARDFTALLIFWGTAALYLHQRRHGRSRISGPVLVLVYALCFSLLGFDLVMALDPHWHSNLAGGYFFMSGLYIAIACWGLLATLGSQAEPDQLQDIGKLVVAFSLMSTYLMYAHLLPFWYENLPREIRFLVPRMHNESWRGVSYLLVGLVYFGPLVLLLTIKSKRTRWSLGGICLLVLVGMWIERWWLVAPTFQVRLDFGLSELSLAAANIGILGLGMEMFHRYLPQRPMAGEGEEGRP